jgi:uncharacterized protein YbbC (DUF1343 family)
LSCQTSIPTPAIEKIVTGAEKLHSFVGVLEDKKVGLVVNPSSMVGNTHLLDTLLSLNVNVTKVFSPEHGLRGDKDAGEKVDSGIDAATGLPIVSLYGKNKKPTQEQMQGLDILIFDIQDVGARFYTYISTLHYIMEACAESNTQLMVLDRPNPNGHYIAGPILEMAHKSFVGMHPVPIVHGLTMGEYARMINGEGWLENSIKCDLTIIKMDNWDHNTSYDLPVKPSPNLPNSQSIALYPSLCLFEGTIVSVGRGTTNQFQVIGHPNFTDNKYQFTPVSMEGAKSPPLENKVCYGMDLTDTNVDGFTLKYLIAFYENMKGSKTPFFNSFFQKLVGNTELQKQIESGISETEILNGWANGLADFQKTRTKYLLYKDFDE